MIEFHLSVNPPKTTSQTKRLVMVGGKPRFFPKKEHADAEANLLSLMRPYRLALPMAGPLDLRVSFTFPWRKSETKANKANGMLPNDVRPDCDNLVKLICDVMTKLKFYHDDGQIARLNVSKWWGDDPGIYICMKEIIG